MIAVAVAIALAMVLVVGRAFLGGDDRVIVAASDSVQSERSESAAGDVGPGSTESTAVADSIVHVVGAVLRPGVYRLTPGARVADAVEMAGGLLGNAAQGGVNMARPVEDGEQVCVPTQEEYEAGFTPGGPSDLGSPSHRDGLLDLNSADEAALEELPGIGPATAAKIVADREERGPFQSTEDLMRVSGIGVKKYEAMQELITTR
jgi:competence protein ComEA